MTLREWLKKNKMSAESFGLKVDASEGAVLKWASGERFPRPESLARIQMATGGKVMANDFMKAATPSTA
jgi:hypothetical protein